MSRGKSADDYHRPVGRTEYSPRIYAACRDAVGRTWAAWHSTEGPLETICVMSPQACPESEAICEPGLNFEPALAPGTAEKLWCIWSRRTGDSWGIVARERIADGWDDTIEMPSDDDFIFHAAAACDASDKLWIAYAAWDHGTEPRVFVRYFDGGKWSAPISFGDLPAPQIRPVMVTSGDSVWLAFSAYSDGAFRVITAEIRDGVATVRKVPTEGGRTQDMHPDLCLDATGTPWLAWVTYTDVLREDVVARQTNAKCAVWDGSTWSVSPGADSFVITRLDWGMLPVETYWGYNGLRHRPQLNRVGDSMGLFWERHRTEHSVPGNVGNGQFCARFNDGVVWGESKLIQSGHSAFVVRGMSPQPAECLIFACKLSPRDLERNVDITFLSADYDELERLEGYPDELWAEWQPVTLPSGVTGNMPADTIKRGADTFHLVWGDLHCHSWYSPDAEGEPLDLLLYARDRGALDFCCIIDNDYYPHVVMSRSAMDYLYAVAQSFDDSEFAAFWGYEYTYHEPAEGGSPKNHRAVVYYDRDQPIARRCDEDGRSHEAFLATMDGTATLWHPHHEEWNLWGHTQEDNIEAAAGWGDYMKWTDVSQRHLKAGFRFGLTAASDNHRICPGMGGASTGLYVRKLSREGVVEALKARRCFATTGCRVLVDFRVNDHLQGSAIESPEAPRLSLSVRSGVEIEEVRVYRDEELIANFQPRTGDFDWYHTDDAAAGTHCYRAEVRQDREIKSFPHNIAQAAGPMAYSSPIWVKIR